MITLQDLFLAQLSDMHDAEQRIVTALPKLVEAATCSQLKAALGNHLTETKGHITKIEAAFKSIGKKVRGKKCEATVGLLKEADEIIADFEGSAVINSAVIAAAQKIEHYEIATYGCLHAWANLLKHTEAAALMETILGEEKASNQKLIELAKAKNKEACGGDSNKGEPHFDKNKQTSKELVGSEA